MECVIRDLAIEELKARLALCEYERLTLAREVLSSLTPPKRRGEALIHRAEIQTRSLNLLRDLAALEWDRSGG